MYKPLSTCFYLDCSKRYCTILQVRICSEQSHNNAYCDLGQLWTLDPPGPLQPQHQPMHWVHWLLQVTPACENMQPPCPEPAPLLPPPPLAVDPALPRELNLGKGTTPATGSLGQAKSIPLAALNQLQCSTGLGPTVS